MARNKPALGKPDRSGQALKGRNNGFGFEFF
jgi:hypothetical protein